MMQHAAICTKMPFQLPPIHLGEFTLLLAPSLNDASISAVIV